MNRIKKKTLARKRLNRIERLSKFPDSERGYLKENSEIRELQTQVREARKINPSVPPYVKRIYRDEIKNIILQSRDLTKKSGIEHVVCFIVKPGHGGELHPDNLEILTVQEKNLKGDRYDGTLENNSWRILQAKKIAKLNKMRIDIETPKPGIFSRLKSFFSFN